jgi:hypothetical protein
VALEGGIKGRFKVVALEGGNACRSCHKKMNVCL